MTPATSPATTAGLARSEEEAAPLQGLTLSRARLRRGPGRAGALAAIIAEGAARDAGHALIWTLFPEGSGARPFLYRETERGSFLILSLQPPVDTEGLWTLDSKPFAPDLDAGDRLGFSLRANATIADAAPRSADGSLPRGRRIGLVTRAAATGQTPDALARHWLAARLHAAGAALCDPPCVVRFEAERTIIASSGARVRFAPVLFEGVLRVTDPAPFLAALAAGFGRSRAYGMGLMLIRPAGPASAAAAGLSEAAEDDDEP